MYDSNVWVPVTCQLICSTSAIAAALPLQSKNACALTRERGSHTFLALLTRVCPQVGMGYAHRRVAPTGRIKSKPALSECPHV